MTRFNPETIRSETFCAQEVLRRLGIEGGVLCLGTDRQLRLAPDVKGLRTRRGPSPAEGMTRASRLRTRPRWTAPLPGDRPAAVALLPVTPSARVSLLRAGNWRMLLRVPTCFGIKRIEDA